MAMASMLPFTVVLLSVVVPALGQPWFNVVTFNTALTGTNNFSSYYSQRRQEFVARINRNSTVWANADVVCLQEVVGTGDRTAIVESARSIGFTHVVQDLVLENTKALGTNTACDPVKAVQLQTCIRSSASHCAPFASQLRQYLSCVSLSCRDEVAKLSQTCINCIISGGKATSLPACVLQPAASHTTHLGLLLLSKREILNPTLVPFSTASDLYRRGYIRADIRDIGAVLCTHLYPYFESLSADQNVPGGLRNRGQVQALVTAALGHQAIIAGDLNTSPGDSNTGISELFPDSYSLFAANGLSSPFASQSSASCTFCADNPILQENNGTTYSSSILDHVIINRQVFNVDMQETKRVFTENVAKVTERGADNVPLSDHYGVQVRLQASATMCFCSATLVWLTAISTLYFQL